MRRRWVVTSALLAILLAGAVGPVDAASANSSPLVDSVSEPAAPDAQIGRLSLFRRGALVMTVTYVNCPGGGRSLPTSGTVETFNNMPADGCEVVLRNKAGGTFEVCIGHGSIPSAFQQSPLVRIRAGDSVLCS